MFLVIKSVSSTNLFNILILSYDSTFYFANNPIYLFLDYKFQSDVKPKFVFTDYPAAL